MRIGYLHCFSGISGDMFLGALVDVGVPFEFMRETAQALNLGADLQYERVDRSGLSAVKVQVIEVAGEAVSEANHTDPQVNSNPQPHGHDAAHGHTHSSTGQTDHIHGRSLSTICALIEQAALAPEVKRMAIRAFELLGVSEAKMHNTPIEKVHFHEVGAVDAIVDIVCGCAGAFSLGVDQWVSSPLNVGSGTVRCAHGVFPVPAPATVDLLQGAPIYAEGPEGERVTPTGAALIRALGCGFGSIPRMRADASGYGAGSRNLKDYPNVLRITVGESQTPVIDSSYDSASSGSGEMVAVLETAIDDSTPQVVGYLMEAALAAGALDVMTTPVNMKKNRPGMLITILCQPEDTTRFCELLFRETSTIGVRTRLDRRQCLQREIVTLDTQWGEVRVKIARLNGEIVNAVPEFEDCRHLAQLHQAPLKEIQNTAMIEYVKTLNGSEHAGQEPEVSAIK